VHRTLAIGGATLMASMAFAGPAMADTVTPVPLSFNNVVLDTPATGDGYLVSPTTTPLTLTADVDTTTGAFSIQPADFSAPTYSFTSPATGTASVTLADPATGVVDPMTGSLTMTADFLATITINDIGSCQINTGPQTLTTATTAPLAGLNFPVGTTGFVTGEGAFGVGWSTLPPGTGSACTFINKEVDGPGGLWIARTTPPTLALTVTKKPKFVKIGTTAVIDATLANSGGADASPVKVCLADKKPLAPTSQCMVVATQGVDAQKKLAFKLNTTKAKAGTYKLTLTTTGLKTQTLTLKVEKK
jgi:hypothetical protein